MKKLLSCLLFFTIFQSVISASNGSCCSYKKTDVITGYQESKDPIIQPEFHPLFIFDLQFN